MCFERLAVCDSLFNLLVDTAIRQRFSSGNRNGTGVKSSSVRVGEELDGAINIACARRERDN